MAGAVLCGYALWAACSSRRALASMETAFQICVVALALAVAQLPVLQRLTVQDLRKLNFPSATDPEDGPLQGCAPGDLTRWRPDGHELRWRQLGVKGLQSDPQLPFFLQWEIDAALHPSAGADGTTSLAGIEIAGDPQRVSEWLGETVEAPLEDVKVEWVAPHGTPGILAAQVLTANGIVRL